MNRLIIFGQIYQEGIRKIFEREAAHRGNRFFYLCLDDGATMDLTQFNANASVYAFSRRIADIHLGLVPDPYILGDIRAHRVPVKAISPAELAEEFSQRDQKIYWRGASNGSSERNSLEAHSRISFCINASKFPERIDAKISLVSGDFESSRYRKRFERMGILGEYVDEAEFGRYTGYVDLEGYASAWGTFRKYLRCIHIYKPEPKFAHYLDFFLEEGNFTSYRSFSELAMKASDDFEIAYRGYLSTLRVIERIKSGDATIFPITHP